MSKSDLKNNTRIIYGDKIYVSSMSVLERTLSCLPFFRITVSLINMLPVDFSETIPLSNHCWAKSSDTVGLPLELKACTP